MVAVVLVASAACSDSGAVRGSDHVNPTLATNPPRTTTTNPYAVPAVIDEAYVNRVLAGLESVIGDAVRLVVRTKTIPQEVLDRLRAIYGTPEARQFSIDGFQIDLRNGLRNYRSDIGDRSSSVIELIAGRSDCIFAKIFRDYSAVSVNLSAVVNPQWVAMKRLDQAADPHSYNPTPWAMIYDGFSSERSQPGNPCVV